MTAKIVFQTDLNGLFIGTTAADPCPIEDGVWLIPAGCVETQPPTIPNGKAAHWDGENWHLIDCLLGLTAYNTATGKAVQVDRLGALPIGYTLKVPGPHQVWRNAEWVDDIPAVVERLYAEQYLAINSTCESVITAGFISAALGEPHVYSSQLDDQLNLIGAILRAADMPYACRDVQSTKAFRLHTFDQLRQVGEDFTLYKLQLLQHANALKQQLDIARAASDVEALALVTWEAV